MSRNNSDRLGPQDKSGETPVTANPMEFVTPTEFVELPSKGTFYPESHPLHNEDVIEIRYMTAKEEDILTSQTLLKKGIAIDRFLQNIIISKQIKVDDLLIGDKNAILIAARSSGYGNMYDTTVACPACNTRADISFDLEDKQIKESMIGETENVNKTSNGTFMIKMPFSKFDVEIKLLTGKDERYLSTVSAKKKKGKMADTLITDQYKLMVVSVQGNSERGVVNHYAENMPLRDSRFLKSVYKAVNPDVKIIEAFECNSCGHDQMLEVPFGADFLWPDR